MGSIQILIFLGICSLFTLTLGKTDQTIVPYASGKDVTEAVLARIKSSGVFLEDHFMMRRVAWVESKFGAADHTFRSGHFGGIWQISEDRFNRTKEFALREFHIKLAEEYGIVWASVTWEDCLKPLHSALAARLFLHLVRPDNDYMPGTLQKQAELWFDQYTDNYLEISKEEFMKQVKELEAVAECEGRADICIVLDGSGSIAPSDFQTARQFVVELIETFSFVNVRVAFLVYSTEMNIQFRMDNNLTRSEMLNVVRNTPHPREKTYTNQAIHLGVELFQNATARPGVAQIMTVLTDGESTDGVTTGPGEALRNNITTLSVGIGSGIGRDELLLIANGILGNVYSLQDFDALEEFFYKLNWDVCEVPQVPEFGDSSNDTLVQNEKRYYRVSIPAEGVTVTVNDVTGQTNVYYSFTHETPNSAFNDGVIRGPTFVRPPTKGFEEGEEEARIFVAVQGVAEENAYEMKFETGNTVPPSDDNGSSGLVWSSFMIVLSVCSAFWF